MVAKALLTIATLTAIFEIVVTVLGHAGLLGHGDTGFIRFVWSGGVAALLATLTGIIAIALGLTHRLNTFGVVSTTVLAVSSVGLFLVVLLK